MRARVDLIVLNWNGLKDTCECVDSLLRTRYPDFGIIIVDNGSTDGSEEALRKKYPGLLIVQTGRNLGFAAGMNAGLDKALERGADYCVLVNNDAVIDEYCVAALVAAAQMKPSAGLLCAKVYFYDRPEVIWYAGASFNPLLGWGRHRGYNEKDTGQYDKIENTRRPCGCVLMASRKFLEKAGLFDEEYFCYCEDLDWGERARKMGFGVFYVPGANAWHKVSASTGGNSTALPLYYTVRNTLKCVNKNQKMSIMTRSLLLINVVVISFLSLFSMNIPKLLGLKRIAQGVRDYLLHRFGEFQAGIRR